ncbi:MAG: glycosyltransferase family 2 protein [Proteobacteria bacterium]|nr:glycosyltransferase family 2 protein [Pseudomonadota bacterium]
MSFSPCLLIPIYNHKDSIPSTVAWLLPHGLPILIVDDGSDAATQQVLAALAATQPLLRLFRLPHNAGKGAAVMRGLREAQAAGYSHALQIDADGQHDAADVPRFLARGAARPAAVICGRPIYDASVPKGRLYGRYLTHFWVWVETLSLSIGDSMCGFRLYPLATTCALLDRVRIPTRMDFDIEIIVRLAWDGVPIENLDTRVTYPADGVSHFDMLRDNLRITKMHTRLVFSMLPRAPRLLWRRMLSSTAGAQAADGHASHHWSRLAERGGGLGLRIVFACYRRLGERAARALLYPVVGYFYLTGAQARTASAAYLHRVAAHAGKAPPRRRDSFRHMLAFAQSGLDKLAAWMGRLDGSRVDFPNRAEFDRLLASGRGAVLIGAHLGNLEMTRALAHGRQLATVNAVVYTEHAQHFNRMLAAANADFGVNLLQVSSLGPDTAILLRDKIDRGELLVIVGDRTPPADNGRVCEAEFLGAPAPFAQGPFILASLLDCPVYLFFCVREDDIDGCSRYRIHFEPFAERIELPRRERQARLQAWVQRYARRLEAHCLAAPYQWFNFYDFWRRAPGAGLSAERTAGGATDPANT